MLDCLHTFCGSCLKEWFSWQAVRARSSGPTPRFTCPACRAAVRSTRPNATVTTLLEMVLIANPERDRTAEEKADIAKKYKPGDPVLVSSSASDAESDSEGRLPLPDNGSSRRRRASTSRAGDQRRHRSADTRDRRHQISRHGASQTGPSIGDSDPQRRIEHQSSLRSLLSASDVEDNTQEEIVRLIMEEGLLDGINLSGLDQSQEEELSDRLVQIFLSRHPDRSRQPQRRLSDQTEIPRSSEHRHSRSHILQGRTDNAISTETSPSRPPVSRPHLLGVTPNARGHRRRASDDGRRRRTSPTPTAPASTSENSLRLALRSSSDITNSTTRPSTSRPRTRESSTTSITRRSTEPKGRASEVWTGLNREGTQQSAAPRQVVSSPLTNSPSRTTPTERIPSASSTSLPGVSGADAQSPPGHTQPSTRRNTAPRSAPARQTPTSRPSTQFVEPVISCARCGRQGIQYDLHKRCPKCENGNYHVCLHCYRIDRGCPHYYGVGTVGQMNYNRAHHPALRSNAEPPHKMISQRYERPKEGSLRGTTDGKLMTIDSPSGRLQEGNFCDVCHSAANGCFWQCDECNEGEWGYCRHCVNQGRCCNHPLLPLRRVLPDAQTPPPTDATMIGSMTNVALPPNPSDTPATYQVLSFSTECDICKYPIAPSSTRFHCLQCNDGDYDICTNCYLKLVVSGKISKENGHSGWRRCFKGHRMIVIGYEDHEKGQRRVIVRKIVGGYTLKDEQTSNHPHSNPSATSGTVTSPEIGTGNWSWKEGNTKRRKAGRSRASPFTTTQDGSLPASPSSQPASSPAGSVPPTSTLPPDGGIGLVLCANWSYFAEESCSDELSFPRGAEITEAENINDEWYWGYYAGRTGLFPGAYCSLVREVL